MKLPCTVDGLNGEESISSFFAGKYKDLYNYVFYNVSDMDALIVRGPRGVQMHPRHYPPRRVFW